ncbi:alpha/beta hydrolase family esterase [Corynebacterium mayonis]|uniref:alpha/beta hydrolase family esterase n=1 Tax=Corynebacterium mayonis TaxID=3062461 RepID=UPI003140BC7C
MAGVRTAALAACTVALSGLLGCSQPQQLAQPSATPSPTPVHTTTAPPPAQNAGALPRDEAGKPTIQRRHIKAAGLDRTYIISIPPHYDALRALPLILVFHGYGESAEKIRNYSNLEKSTAIVVFMDGMDSAWAPAPYATTTGDQDLAFVDAVRRQVEGEFRINKARVFAAGLSNGGGFATYVGCQRPQTLTAIATVSAAFYAEVSESCSTIPLKHVNFHGTNDPVMEYGGGQRHKASYESIATVLNESARRNHCLLDPIARDFASGVAQFTWLHCDASLIHYQIHGGRHVWPSFATEVLLDFFGVDYDP